MTTTPALDGKTPEEYLEAELGRLAELNVSRFVVRYAIAIGRAAIAEARKVERRELDRIRSNST